MRRALSALVVIISLLATVAPGAGVGHSAPDLDDREDFIVQGTIGAATPHTAIHTTYSATGGVVSSVDVFYFSLEWDQDEFGGDGNTIIGVEKLGPAIEALQPGDVIGTNATMPEYEELRGSAESSWAQQAATIQDEIDAASAEAATTWEQGSKEVQASLEAACEEEDKAWDQFNQTFDDAWDEISDEMDQELDEASQRARGNWSTLSEEVRTTLPESFHATWDTASQNVNDSLQLNESFQEANALVEDTRQQVYDAREERTCPDAGDIEKAVHDALDQPSLAWATLTDTVQTTLKNTFDTIEPFLYSIELYFWDEEDRYVYPEACLNVRPGTLETGDQRACTIPEQAHYVEVTALYAYDLSVTVGLEEPVIVLEEGDIACTDQACTLDASASYTTIGEIDEFRWYEGAHEEEPNSFRDEVGEQATFDLGTDEVTLFVENDEGVVASKTVTLDA